MSKKKRDKKAWPTRKAMEQVYSMKLWGTNNTPFYSGEGSHNPLIVTPYVSKIRSFLTSFNIPLTVCDFGCGDFNIGSQLFEYTKKYTAVDIVPDLIAYNNSHFKAKHLDFVCLDVAVDSLPSADCAIIRQVFQHLSNNEIQQVLNKLSGFKYLILTEHLPDEFDFVPNKDIISGQGIRIKKKSGVDIVAPPFNFEVKESKELLRQHLGVKKGVIVTTLYSL